MVSLGERARVRDDGDSALRIVGIFYELCELLLQWLQFYGNLDRELVKCIPIGTRHALNSFELRI